MKNELIEARILIEAPARAVYGVWADVANWSSWDPDTRQAHLDGAFAVGSRGRLWPRKGLAVRMAIVEAVSDKSFTVECPVLGNVMRFEHELVDASGGVEVIHRVQFRGWLSGWLRRTVGREVRQGLPVTLQSLKSHVERGVDPAGNMAV